MTVSARTTPGRPARRWVGRALRVAVMLVVWAGVSAATPSVGFAEDVEAAAQGLFEAGVKLMDEGRYADAVSKLEESYRLSPDVGTQYRLAVCFDKLGRRASAWAAWGEVADKLEKAGETQKGAEARKRAEELLGTLAHVKIVVAAGVGETANLVVRRDGVVVGRAAWGTSIPVDPGPHEIVASAPGKTEWRTTITVTGGPGQGAAPVEVRIPELADAKVMSGPPGGAAASGPVWRTPVLVVAASLGVAGLGIGGGFGGAAIMQWNAALDRCEGRDVNRCDARGIRLGEEADMFATVSTAGFIAGGAGVLAAGVVWLAVPGGSPVGGSPAGGAGPGGRGASMLRSGWFVPVIAADRAGLAVGATF